jgi:hypothetical protein
MVKLKKLNYICIDLGYPPLFFFGRAIGVSVYVKWVGMFFVSGNWMVLGGCGHWFCWCWAVGCGCGRQLDWLLVGWLYCFVLDGYGVRGCVATFSKNNPFFVATFQILSLTL